MSETVVQVISIIPPRVSLKELATCTGLLMQICKWRLRELVGLVAALQARIEQRSERWRFGKGLCCTLFLRVCLHLTEQTTLIDSATTPWTLEIRCRTPAHLARRYGSAFASKLLQIEVRCYNSKALQGCPYPLAVISPLLLIPQCPCCHLAPATITLVFLALCVLECDTTRS